MLIAVIAVSIIGFLIYLWWNSGDPLTEQQHLEAAEDQAENLYGKDLAAQVYDTGGAQVTADGETVYMGGGINYVDDAGQVYGHNWVEINQNNSRGVFGGDGTPVDLCSAWQKDLRNFFAYNLSNQVVTITADFYFNNGGCGGLGTTGEHGQYWGYEKGVDEEGRTYIMSQWTSGTLN